MKQINLFAILMIAILTSCESKTKHIVVETEKTILADEEFSVLSVDNEYSISVPSFTEDKNDEPDRFSLIRVGTNLDCDLDLDNMAFGAIYVESNTQEAYEARRNKEGNLDKYPFTLEGLCGIALNKTPDLIGLPQKTTINDMPALSQSFKATLDITVAKIDVKGYIMHIQAPNGTIYRIKVIYPPFETESEEDVPQWVLEVCNSFKLL